MAAEDYGLVVGIDEYGEPPGALKGAKQDATDFLDWLKSPKGGNVPATNVDPFVRLSNAGGTEPTFSHLLVLLTKLRNVAPVGKKRIGRRLYIFLAGHGVATMEDLDETGLVTIESQDLLTQCLPGKKSADGFVLGARFDEVVLFMDCCRLANLLLKPLPDISTGEKPDTKAAAKVKRFYVYASAFGKPARETKHGAVTRGIFSRVLIDGLKGGASADAQGRLTTTQLRAYLEKEMKLIIVDGEEQVPKFPSTDEIVLVEGAAPTRVTINVKFSRPIDKILIQDGGNNLAPVTPEEDVATPDGRRFSVPWGKTYLLEAQNADGTPVGLIAKVKASEGEQLDVTL
jgi:hypothetical protein